jgi:hypothetical protein
MKCHMKKEVSLPHKTIILPVVLYGCETWSLTLREEQGAEEDIWTEEG